MSVGKAVGVRVGGIEVRVGGMGVRVGGIGVHVGGTGVSVGGTAVGGSTTFTVTVRVSSPESVTTRKEYVAVLEGHSVRVSCPVTATPL